MDKDKLFEETFKMNNENNSDVTVDYIGFWKAIEESKINGNAKLKELIKDGKIQIGDSIPNIEFWNYLKKKKLNETTENNGHRLLKLDGNHIFIPLDDNPTSMSLDVKSTNIQIDNDTLNSEGTIPMKNGKNEIKNETVFKIILDNVFNGHELILDIFDTFITGNCLGCKDTKNEKIEVNLYPLFKRYNVTAFSKKKMRLVQELIEIQNESGNDENIRKIFNHPVVKILILKKWEDAKGYYSFNVNVFTLFLLLFTFFVRLQIIESNETLIFDAKISDPNVTTNFSFSVRNSEFAKLTDYSHFSVHYLPPEKCQDENFAFGELSLNQPGDLEALIQECRKNKLLDYMDMNLTFIAHNFEHDIDAVFTGQIVTGDESGEFTANVTELSKSSSALNNPGKRWQSLFTILKNEPRNFHMNIIIYIVIMGGVLLSQLLGVLRHYLELKFEKNSITKTYNKREQERKEQNMYHYIWNVVFIVVGNFFFCISGFSGGIFLKIVLMVLFIFLVSAEIVQFKYLVITSARRACRDQGIIGFFTKVFGARYWRDPENYLEMIFLASVPLSIFVPDWELAQPESDEKRNIEWKLRAIYRGFIAVGVFSGWIDLIIKKGNVSYSGVGDFIKMFYNIIKNKLFSYLKVVFFLVTAFSLSFWIVMDGHVEDVFSKGFWFSQVLTTTMSTGEFNTGDFYQSIKGNGVTKVFAMLFLVGLIFFCTITMINLLVAAIINDYNQMKDEVAEENLLFIAEYVIEFERLVKKLEKYFKPEKTDDSDNFCNLDLIKKVKECFFRVLTKLGLTDIKRVFKLEYCPHLICRNCALEPLPIPRPGTHRYTPAMEANERNPLLLQILSILEKKATKESLCGEHKEMEVAAREFILDCKCGLYALQR